MSEIKVLSIVLAILVVLGLSLTFFCIERKSNYPEETFPVSTYIPTEEEITVREETITGFVPSPSSPTIPFEGTTVPSIEETTEPIIEETTNPPIVIPTPPPIITSPPTEETPSPTEPPVIETEPPQADLEPEVIKYPEATYIWNYLTQTLGYNNYVAAGILGNIMAEVGGGTLAINPTLYSYGNRYYYGICQWNKGDFGEIHGASLEQQVEFLGKTMLRQFKTQTRLNTFLSLQNARDAAKMFNTWYERGAGSEVRANCAEVAYNYFVNQTA